MSTNGGQIRAALYSLGMRSGKGKDRDMEFDEKIRAKALQSITDHSVSHMPGLGKTTTADGHGDDAYQPRAPLCTPLLHSPLLGCSMFI